MKGNIELFRACFVLLTWIPFYGQAQTKVYIDGSLPTHQVSRHIYGHFSERLGRCVYDSFWVADSMQVMKKERIRLDIVHISLVNIDPLKIQDLQIALSEISWNTVSGSIISSEKYSDYNDFDNKTKIGIKPFTGAKKSGSLLTVALPPKSIVTLELI